MNASSFTFTLLVTNQASEKTGDVRTVWPGDRGAGDGGGRRGGAEGGHCCCCCLDLSLATGGARERCLDRVSRALVWRRSLLRLYTKLSRADVAANRLSPLGLGEARDWLSLHRWHIRSPPMGLCHLDPSSSIVQMNGHVINLFRVVLLGLPHKTVKQIL